MSIENKIKPELVVAGSAMLWGLFWIPLRAFERNGLDPGWTTIFQFLVPFLFLLPIAIYRRINHLGTGVGQWQTGILIGAAFALYCASLMLTDVVRALILFYVAPAWGTVLEVFFMGRRFTVWRGLALLLSMLGLVAILGASGDIYSPLNSGDIMSLLSGIIFSVGAMKVRQATEVSVFEQVFAFFVYGGLSAFVLSLLPVAELGGTPDIATIKMLYIWLILMALGFLIPVMAGIYWGSKFVDPGRLGILLQLEAVVGIISAALFAGEQFGILEALGAILVVSAGLVELTGSRYSSQTHNSKQA